MKKIIGLVDYGASNIVSVERALELLNFEYIKITSFDEISSLSTILIPGVGNFKNASEILIKNKFNYIKNELPNKRPFVIGICLGMQLLFTKGTEGGESRGLDLLKGTIKKTIECKPKNIEIPNTLVGWDNFKINDSKNFSYFNYLSKFQCDSFYHVHSFMCIPENKEQILATYPGQKSFIPSIVGSKKDRVIGFQFHPEKSGKFGINLLKNAIENSFY